MYLAINSAVNAIGHRFGSKAYENTARNNQWLAWLTVGEGLHNNHHAAPTSAKFALKKRQIDPGWWIISGLVRTGQAKVRLNEVRLARDAPSRRRRLPPAEPAGRSTPTGAVGRRR